MIRIYIHPITKNRYYPLHPIYERTYPEEAILLEGSAELVENEESSRFPGFEAIATIGLLGAVYYVHKRRV